MLDLAMRAALHSMWASNKKKKMMIRQSQFKPLAKRCFMYSVELSPKAMTAITFKDLRVDQPPGNL